MRLYLFYLLAIVSTFESAGQVTIETEGIKSFVNGQKDSVFIQGLDNSLHIYLDDNTSSLFSFELVGFDTVLRTSPFPSFRYTNIPGGEFNFRYKAKEATSFSTIKVSVMEAVWQKWWFWPMIVLYILLLGGIATFLFFQYNYRQKLKVEQLRNKIATDLHDEVGSNLSSISIFTEVLKKQLKTDPSKIDSILRKIKENSAESVTLMQDTVWALNPSNDGMEKLISRIISFGSEILGSKGITFNHQVDVDISKIQLDMEARKNCFLILKEGINNIAKHSMAKNARLNVEQANHKTIFRLMDDGIGFDHEGQKDGNGLLNFKKRAQASDFVIEIKSTPNEGTEIKLVI